MSCRAYQASPSSSLIHKASAEMILRPKIHIESWPLVGARRNAGISTRPGPGPISYNATRMRVPRTRKSGLAMRGSVRQQTFPGGHPSLPEDPFYRTTAIFQLLRSAKRLMSRGNIEDEAGKFYIAVREHRRNASKMLDELPDLSSALAEYARNLNRIIDIIQDKSVRVILLTQPTMWRPDLPKNLDALLLFCGVTGRCCGSARRGAWNVLIWRLC